MGAVTVIFAGLDSIPVDQISQFSGYGIVGAVAIILGWRVWQLEKEKTAHITARLADWKEIGEMLKANGLVLANWTTANEARTRAIEANARAQEMAASSHSALGSEISMLRETVGEAIQSNRAMREALLKQGLPL